MDLKLSLAALIIAQKHGDFIIFFKYMYYMPGVHENKLWYPQNYSLKTCALREILDIYGNNLPLWFFLDF